MSVSADFAIGGSWGDAIHWSNPEQFSAAAVSFSCHGWKRVRPKKGQTIKAEFQKSWRLFEFTEVDLCRDPPDMFFARVKLIKSVPKE